MKCPLRALKNTNLFLGIYKALHMHRKDLRRSKFSSWVDLDDALCKQKWRLRRSYTPAYYTEALGKGGKVFGSESSCGHWQTTKWTKQRLQGLRLTKIETPLIFLDWFCKQEQQQTQGSIILEADFQNWNITFLKVFSFQQKIMRYPERTGKYGQPHSKGKQLIETVLEESLGVGWSTQNLNQLWWICLKDYRKPCLKN